MSNDRLRLTLPLVLLGALAASCHASKAASEGGGSSRPPGEVWLTPTEVSAAKVEVAAVAEQDVDDMITTSGTVTLDDLRTGHVFSPVTGRVVKIEAQLGDHVKKGQALAAIESPDIGRTVSDVHKAEADLIAATHDLRRKRDLFDDKAASAADVEQAEDAERNAKAELERARQKQFLLRVGNVDVVTGTFSLPSPIEGEILMRNINPGIEVQGQYSGGATQELFTIGEIDRVWVLGDIYEVDLARVHVGATALVTTVAYPDKIFKGTVDWVSGSLDPNTRTAKVRCTFDNPDKLLRPMMYSTVQIATEQRKALAVPPEAVVRLGEYKVAFVQIGDVDGKVRFERVPIDVDERRMTLASTPDAGHDVVWVTVKHGLDAGQKVVIRGADALSQKL